MMIDEVERNKSEIENRKYWRKLLVINRLGKYISANNSILILIVRQILCKKQYRFVK